MIRSMTAFSRVIASPREGNWAVEIRSINHRYFEFSLKIPPALSALENRIREVVQTGIPRGKVTVAISKDSAENGNGGISLNEQTLKFYFDAIGKLKKRYKLAGEISVSDVLKLPGIFTAEHKEEDPEKIWAGLQKILKRSIQQAIKAKELEGSKLACDVTGRLEKITKAVQKIESLSAGRTERVFKKLSERVDSLLAEKEKDPERTHREVAFLAERSDITEEVVRMKSHLDLFRSRLKTSTEIGRELDFLCQEMNREINTMGSKAQIFEISTEVVFVKGELEKIREQIQNIE